MRKIYVAREGIAIPGGWPADGRSINPVSSYQRNLVRDGDLVLKRAANARTKPTPKKDDADGK